MLLVKSRESKNLNKPCSPNIVLASVSSFLLVTLSMPVQANANTASLTSAGSILTVFLSLMVVIAIIFAFAYVMRRFNVASMGNGQMRVVASMMAGTKEKVMVIEVGDEQHLLGITVHNINHLAKLDKPICKENATSKGNQTPKGNFQQKLVNAMAQGLTGANKQSDSGQAKSKGVDHD